MNQPQATQSDVAQLAGVTRATVSYVLNGRAEQLKITEAVIKRVEEAARKLDYHPNLSARSLAAGRSCQLGLLVPQGYVHTHYWGLLASGVERAALEANYDVLLLARGGDPYQMAESYLRQRRVDGIIILGEPPDGGWLQLPMPPVVMGGRRDSYLPRVVTDMEPAIARLCKVMKEKLCSRMIWIGPLQSLEDSSSDRLSYLRQHCGELGIDLVEVELHTRRDAHWSVAEEVGAWKRLMMDANPRVEKGDCLVCWNDFLALGAYGYLARWGMEPGRDVAVVGFDNSYAEAALPPLSSIGFNVKEMGEAAVRITLELIAKSGNLPSKTCPVIETAARLHVRESLGRHP